MIFLMTSAAFLPAFGKVLMSMHRRVTILHVSSSLSYRDSGGRLSPDLDDAHLFRAIQGNALSGAAHMYLTCPLLLATHDTWMVASRIAHISAGPCSDLSWLIPWGPPIGMPHRSLLAICCIFLLCLPWPSSSFLHAFISNLSKKKFQRPRRAFPSMVNLVSTGVPLPVSGGILCAAVLLGYHPEDYSAFSWIGLSAIIFRHP